MQVHGAVGYEVYPNIWFKWERDAEQVLFLGGRMIQTSPTIATASYVSTRRSRPQLPYALVRTPE